MTAGIRAFPRRPLTAVKSDTDRIGGDSALGPARPA